MSGALKIYASNFVAKVTYLFPGATINNDIVTQ